MYRQHRIEYIKHQDQVKVSPTGGDAGGESDDADDDSTEEGHDRRELDQLSHTHRST